MTGSNASRSIFGWNFQIDAAIVLVLRDIYNLDAVRLEGKTEDIEISLRSGKKYFAQSKASTSNDYGDNATTRFHRATKTLSVALESELCERVVYVTNDALPFGKDLESIACGDGSLLAFDELTSKQQEFVLKSFQNKLDEKSLDLVKERFYVFVMWYKGRDPITLKQALSNATKAFTESIGSNASVTDLNRMWHEKFQSNASNYLDINETISKEDLVWPVIVLECKTNENDKAFEDYDHELVEDALNLFSDLINENVSRISLITQVITDFEGFKKTHKGTPKELRRLFCEEFKEKYIKEIGLDSIDDEDMSTLLSDLILGKIVGKKHVINSIKGKVNL